MQALRYRAHDKLMLAFLEPEVFDGGVHIRRTDTPATQGSLLDGDQQRVLGESP